MLNIDSEGWSIINTIEGKEETKAIVQALMEFLFLRYQNHDEYMDEYRDMFECFNLNQRSFKEIRENIDSMYKVVGLQGIAENYGYVPEIIKEIEEEMPEEQKSENFNGSEGETLMENDKKMQDNRNVSTSVSDVVGNMKNYGFEGAVKVAVTDRMIQSYASGLILEDKVSNKEEPYIAPEIQEVIDSIDVYKFPKRREERGNIKSRAMGGFSVACHVFAYLSGKEKSYGDGWDEERRRCANMICRGLGVDEIYPGLEQYQTENQTDYGIKGKNLIVTKGTITEAFRRYPVNNLDVDWK